MNFLKNLFLVLDQKEKLSFFKLQFLIVFTVFFEVTGISLIIPFTTLIGDLSILEQDNLISSTYKYLEIKDPNTFIIIAGLSVLFFLFLGTVIGVLTTYQASKFASSVGVNMGSKLYGFYISQNWSFHIQNNSGEFVKKIATECQRLIDGVLIPLMQLNSRILLSLFILILLIFTNPEIAIIGFSLFAAVYLLIFSVVRKIVSRNGMIVSERFSERYRLMMEGFGGLKEILLLGKGHFFYNQFKDAGSDLSKKIGANLTFIYSPKYIVEFLAFSAIILLILYLASVYSNNLAEMLPLISLYAVAGLKLLPALQGIYVGFTSISSNKAAFYAIQEDLQKSIESSTDTLIDQKGEIELKRQIVVDKVSYKYPNQDSWVLQDFSISIPAGKLIGVVGPTGSGKSTIIDLILGLISPNFGEIKIDNQVLDRLNQRSWQSRIGYVPQSIFFTDSTIMENIAFGIKQDNIDEQRVKKCAAIASIDNYINELPDNYYSKVGERGVQMSGGQKQRISIARALYHDPVLLVLDEATSALDGITEKKVIESMVGLAGSKTILMIAHRLETVKNCDIIFFIENGKLSASGTFKELVEQNFNFKNFVNAHWVSK